MRSLVFVVAILVLAGCSDEKSGLSPAEKAKRAPRMSEDVWKVYGGVESGVTDDKQTDRKKDDQEKK